MENKKIEPSMGTNNNGELNEMQTAHASTYINPIARAAISDAAVRVAVQSIECILDGDQLAELVGDPHTMIMVYRQVIFKCQNRIDDYEKQIKEQE